MALAWRVANFSAAALNGKKGAFKSLDHYLREMREVEGETVKQAVAAFQSLAARGLVKIREVPKT